MDANHFAFSPRVGLNVEYVGNDEFAGHAYVTAGRSFKAPTLDQLFDRRLLPVAVPGITTSNALLEPQHGISLEAGVYQRATAGSLSALLSLSVYRIDMRDELDFDVQTLRYLNIGRSRHRGVEAGITVNGPGTSAAFLTWTHQDAVARSGESPGRQLKAIPRHFTTAGLSGSPAAGLEAALLLSHARGIFLDDANTIPLPAYTRVDVRVGREVGGVEVTLDVRNILDASYSTTGFPDPSGSPELYYRPAAGRTFELGVRRGF
jgi:outer membrane receptor protein involved in Fe transport